MRFTFILSFFLLMLACKNEETSQAKTPEQAAADSANYTAVSYLDSAKNLGVLTMGQSVEVTFNFKNIGNKPLYIISAEPSCGCTVADFPKAAIAPDSVGKIVAVFDTKKSSVGNFTKVITVTTNTKPNANGVLTFSGEVLSDGKEPAPENIEPRTVPNNNK